MEKRRKRHSQEESQKKSNGRLIDEIGNRYGDLTVLEYAGSGKEFKNGHDGGAAWLCICDCGNDHIALGTKLRMGISKSCGCRNRLPSGEASLNQAISGMKTRAKARGKAWNLSPDQTRKLVDSSCEYCGVHPSNKVQGNTCNGAYVYSGIDRVDNDMGYEKENVVACCSDCNKAKGTKTVKEFMEYIKRIFGHIPMWGIAN